jgi:CheY-like chemotaxis protein
MTTEWHNIFNFLFSFRMISNDPIIIVDDDQDDQFLMRKICEKMNVQRKLIFFEDGREALRYLRTTDDKPFIILSDINMPAMNGLELLREIVKDDFIRMKSIPFIFFSTAASPSQIREAYALTVQGFFVKETSMSKIEHSLRVILDYWEHSKHPA